MGEGVVGGFEGGGKDGVENGRLIDRDGFGVRGERRRGGDEEVRGLAR